MTSDLTHPDLEKKDAELRALAKGGDMTPLEILKQARELISVPERWTRGESARDYNGDYVAENSPSAVCWCALGSMSAVNGGHGGGIYSAARDLLVQAISPIPALTEGGAIGIVAEFNDSHTHAEVLAAFDRAILEARSEP
ncbi:DUF6197 family protein [Labrys neptuniae]